VAATATLPDTITVSEAAKALGVSRQTAYDAARRGEIPAIFIGKRILVPRERFLDLFAKPPATESGADP
jgi:excisionase family DNA binding protein